MNSKAIIFLAAIGLSSVFAQAPSGLSNDFVDENNDGVNDNEDSESFGRAKAAANAATLEAAAAAAAREEADAALEAQGYTHKSRVAEEKSQAANMAAYEAAKAKAVAQADAATAAAAQAAAVKAGDLNGAEEERAQVAAKTTEVEELNYQTVAASNYADKVSRKAVAAARGYEQEAWEAGQRAHDLARQSRRAEQAAQARAAEEYAANEEEANPSLLSMGSFRTTAQQAYVDDAGLTGDADLDADDSIHRSEAASEAAAAEAQAAALAAAEAQHYKEASEEAEKNQEAEQKLETKEGDYYDQAQKKAESLAVASGASAHQGAAVDPADAERTAQAALSAGINAKEQVRINLKKVHAFNAATRVVQRQTKRSRAAIDIARAGSADALKATDMANQAQRFTARRAAEEAAALEFAAPDMF